MTLEERERQGTGAPDDADVLAVAALDAMSGAAHVRATADAMDLRAVATLTVARRAQALAADPAVDLDLVDTSTAGEISLRLGLAPGTARSRMVLALRLTGAVDGPAGYGPATFEALRRGALDLPRVHRLVDALAHLPLPEVDEATAQAVGVELTADASTQERNRVLTDLAVRLLATAQADIEAEALAPGTVPHLADTQPGPPAGELTLAQLDARLRRLVARALPGAHEQRLRDAHERRGCTLRPVGAPGEGLALLQVCGRPDLMQAAFLRLDRTARALLDADRAGGGGTPGAGSSSSRTLDQARVDVLVALVLGDSETLARAHGVSVELSLVAPAGTVLPGAGADRPVAPASLPTGPGELEGHGPVPGSLVRELAGDARWRRWATDPGTGVVTWVSPTTYRPTAAVARLVRARDRECTFPTCRARVRTDLDHVVRFPDGTTTPANLCVTCRRHHRLKHYGSFRTRLEPDGTLTWTTPTGRTVRNPTPSHPPPRPSSLPAGPEPPPPF